MADDKKNIPEAAPPAEAPAPAVENTGVPEQPAPEPALTDAEAVMLEHEGQEALFEMGEVVPDSADAAIHAELEEASTPSDATRAEKEEIVYLNLSDLHPFKNHPFGVRDDAEMQGLVESVKAAGVNQPALVRPREDGGYEIIAGHRRQRASELAGFANMPCIVRNMTDDEAILAMTDDNLRHRERILPTEGDRNGMNYKQVQRYIRLTKLVPDLQKMVDEKKLAFTPAVEISFILPKNQK